MNIHKTYSNVHDANWSDHSLRLCKKKKITHIVIIIVRRRRRRRRKKRSLNRGVVFVDFKAINMM